MIELKTERVLLDNKRYRKITKLKARGVHGLPANYILGYPTVYAKDGGMVICLSGKAPVVWTVGDLVEEKTFQEHVIVIRQAGLRLHMINQAAKSTAWEGNETIRV